MAGQGGSPSGGAPPPPPTAGGRARRPRVINQDPQLWSTRLACKQPEEVLTITNAFQWVHAAIGRIIESSLMTPTELIKILFSRK
eukprot:1203654-Alexandrium_andersonii.AAC.1